MSMPPLSAMTGDTPCGLGLYFSHLRIDSGTFFIVEPTTPVQFLSLLLGTISYRIISRVCSLSHRAIGRRGKPFGKDARRSYPVLGFLPYGTGNAEKLIFGRAKTHPPGQSLPTAIKILQFVISLLKPSLSEPYLDPNARKPSLTWSRLYVP